MKDKRTNISTLFVLLPTFGSLIFILLYIVAALLYPGGSQADKNSVGFSWINNYWCNLLNENAINGKFNPARPFAMTAMFVLGFTLAVFWFLFPRIINFPRFGKTAITFSGIAAMTTAMFIFTTYHDLVINVAGLLGLVALVGTLIGLHKNSWNSLFFMGLGNIVLIAVNNILYYSTGLLQYLPVVQKITFLFFLAWICLIDVQLFLKRKSYNSQEVI